VIDLARQLQSRHLTLADAAGRAGLSTERLAHIVEGSDASLAEMRGIARALRVSLSFLLDDPFTAEPLTVLLRQTLEQRSLGDADSFMPVVAAQLRDALEIARSMPSLGEWLNLFRDLTPSADTAETFAAIFRRGYAGLDDQAPFNHLPQVLEELRVHVLFGRAPKIEGVSAILEGHAFILLAPRSFLPRILFTLAHELGHLVARHDRRGQAFAQIDRTIGNAADAHQRRLDERFADAFASSVLLPRRGVLKVIDASRTRFQASGPLGDVEIAVVARFYGVSFEVAARRCEDLGLLPPQGARALYQRISDDYGNPERRADELGLPPRAPVVVAPSPSLLSEAARRVREGDLSAGRAAELLNVAVSTLYAANTG
jgi:Zn-dependent peptidase ImmA (M78 family)